MTIKQISSLGGEFTLDAPASASNRTIVLPDASTTLVGTDATQTLTNKTLTTPSISQIAFPAVQVPSSDPNTLDDYEEGTFTPTIIGLTTSGSASYSQQSGIYTKVGRVIYISIRLAWSGGTGTGDMAILCGSLPVPGNTYSCAVGYIENVAMSASNYAQLYLDNLGGNCGIRFRQSAVGGGGNGAIPYDVAGDVMVSGFYFV